MRVAVGSMRLTKDVDFDRAEGVSTACVQSSVKKALQYAAQSAGMRGAEIDPGKSTETTVRMRLAGCNVPPDVYDLNDLCDANPEPILAARISREALQTIRDTVLDKVCAIDIEMAQQELPPYIPPRQRDAIRQPRWDEMTLNVAEAVRTWVGNSLQRSGASSGKR